MTGERDDIKRKAMATSISAQATINKEQLKADLSALIDADDAFAARVHAAKITYLEERRAWHVLQRAPTGVAERQHGRAA